MNERKIDGFSYKNGLMMIIATKFELIETHKTIERPS